MFRYRPKDNIFKTLGSYGKNYVHEMINSIELSKTALKASKMKNCVCRSNGVACDQYKDIEEKNSEKQIEMP